MTAYDEQLVNVVKTFERYPSKKEQLEGILEMFHPTNPARGRVIPNVLTLGDEVGLGKTKQVVDCSQLLYHAGDLEVMVVVAPGYARSTWADADPVFGEVAKHAWDVVPNVVHDYHGKRADEVDLSTKALHWLVTNYEFIRQEHRLEPLIKLLHGRKCWTVFDEAWMLKGWSQQMRACRRLRAQRADRVTILNGTPMSDGKATDLYYPFAILDPAIIGEPNRESYKRKYCIVGGYNNKQVVGYQNLEQLNKRIAPYVLARKTRDCWDLPPMLDPITIEARLSPELWSIYRKMRDDMVVWLGDQVSVSKQAIVKVLRLTQITSGYLGGLEDDVPEVGNITDDELNALPDYLKAMYPDAVRVPNPVTPALPRPARPTVKEIGREKLDATLLWLKNNQPKKFVTWCRFRAEVARTAANLRLTYPHVHLLQGGQKPEERRATKHFLAPGGNTEPGGVVGNTGAGGSSLNFAQASVMIFMSHSPALIQRTQAIGRIERPGATEPMQIVDVVAVGPKGQKTTDHHILKALRAKDDLARWTVDQWRRILRDE